MTTIEVFHRGAMISGFSAKGHTGYAEEGEDIVCAAVSAMTMLVINTIEVAWASDVDYTIDDKTTDVTVIARGALPEYEEDEAKRFAISGLIYSYFLQLNDMIEDYYDFIEVDEEEKII